MEQDFCSCKEVLTKAETERGALEVKLKHARNQVDVEIRRRQKAEADCEKLVRGPWDLVDLCYDRKMVDAINWTEKNYCRSF